MIINFITGKEVYMIPVTVGERIFRGFRVDIDKENPKILKVKLQPLKVRNKFQIKSSGCVFPISLKTRGLHVCMGKELMTSDSEEGGITCNINEKLVRSYRKSFAFRVQQVNGRSINIAYIPRSKIKEQDWRNHVENIIDMTIEKELKVLARKTFKYEVEFEDIT